MQTFESRQISDIKTFAKNNKGKTALVLESFLWTPHFETSLEIADQLTKHGMHVIYDHNFLNFRSEDRVSLKIVLNRYFSLKILFLIKYKININGIRSLLNSILIQVKAIFTNQKLSDFSSTDVEDSLFSSAMTFFKTTRIPDNDLKKFKKNIQKSLKKNLFWSKKLIEKHHPDYVIFFNGRFATTRIIRRYCESKAINYIVHERGSSKDKYSLWLNGIPHCPVLLKKSFEDFILSSNNQNLMQIGERFFYDRRIGKTKGWYSYMTEFDSTEMDSLQNQIKGKRVVTYFTSTEDEFLALKQDLPPQGVLADQVSAISIVKKITEELGFVFILRLHPNLATRQSSERSKFPKGEFVIEPGDAVSSYSLIRISDYIFTHNSQIAIEAAALETPSAYTGRTRFEELPCVTKCRTVNDIYLFLSSGANKVKNNLKTALMVGAYLDHYGISFENFAASSLGTGRYYGFDLNERPMVANVIKLLITSLTRHRAPQLKRFHI